MIVVPEDFVRAASGIGQRGKLAADLHQSGRDAVSSAAAALSRQTLAQRQRDGRGQAFAGQFGKLGRKRVCALHQPGVEIPSDYSGVLFVLLDETGGWRLTLARELKGAGLQIDMNKAL